MSVIPGAHRNMGKKLNCPKRNTVQVIEDYRLGLIDSYNIKGKVAYNIFEERKDHELHPQHLNKTKPSFRDTCYMDLEYCEQRYLLTGQMANSISIVDLHNESVEPSTIITLYRNKITGLKWFPSDYRIFSVASKKKLMIWDANELSEIEGIALGTDIISYNHSKHSTLIAVTTCKNPTKLIDLRTGHVSSSLIEPGRQSSLDVAWSPICEFTLASSNNRGDIYIWDTRSAASPLSTIKRKRAVFCVAFYPDGIRLATVSKTGEHALAVFNLVNNSRIFNLNMGLDYWFPSPVSFHYGFMFVGMCRSLCVVGDLPCQQFDYNLPTTEKCYAFRPATFQLYSGTSHGIQKYNFSFSDEVETTVSTDFNFDEFSY